MAKVSQVQKWLAPSVPYTLKLSGAHGVTKELSFQFCLDFNALGLVEKYTGIPLTNPAKIFGALNVTNITILFWAAVQAYHSDDYAGDHGLSVIGSYLNFKNSGPVMDAIWEAFLIAVPEDTAERLKAVVAAAKEAAEKGEPVPEVDPTQTAPASN